MILSCTKKSADNPTTTSSEDSLSNYLTKSNDFGATTKKRQEYIQKAFNIVIEQDNDSLQRTNLFRIANRYYNLNDWKKYREIAKIVLEKAEAVKDTASTAKAYSYLGDYYASQGVSDSAFLYYFKSEKLYNVKEKYNAAKTRLNIAFLQYNESDLLGSEISVFKALKAIKGVKANEILYESNNLLGTIYNELGEYTKAIEYHNKALQGLEKNPTPIEFQYRATSLNNLGLVYQNLNKDKLAIPYFEEGLKQKKDILLYKPLLYAMLLDNLGYSRFKLKEKRGLPELFYESLKIKEDLQLTAGVIINQIHLSEYFAVKGDREKALQYSNEAMLTAKNSKNKRNYLLPLKQLAVLEPAKSALYNKDYIRINDSLQKAERKMGEKFTRIEYETDEIKQENTDLTVQNRNLVYVFGSVLIVGMFLYIIKAQKTKNRELLYKQEQQKANEEIYNLMISQQNDVETIRTIEKKRIAQDLHDGVLGRMFGIRMNLDSLNKNRDKDASYQIVSYLTELKHIEQDIREISHDLSKEKSELINNFVAILNELLENQKKSFSTKLDVFIDPTIQWNSISNAIKINLYRVVQESLQNANKYAKAKKIKIEFKNSIDYLFLHISDDGAGFNVKRAKKGIGLQNMLSRINECKGTFEIQSKKEAGTIITITIPINE